MLEAAGPDIAAALAADPPDTALQARIATLQALIETDRALLERMTQATGTIVTENRPHPRPAWLARASTAKRARSAPPNRFRWSGSTVPSETLTPP